MTRDEFRIYKLDCAQQWATLAGEARSQWHRDSIVFSCISVAISVTVGVLSVLSMRSIHFLGLLPIAAILLFAAIYMRREGNYWFTRMMLRRQEHLDDMWERLK